MTAAARKPEEYACLSLRIGTQLFGVPIGQMRDVLRIQPITPVPLAPAKVAGVIALHGRVIPAIDLRTCLGLGPCPEPMKRMLVVIEHEGEQGAIIVDAIGELLSLTPEQMEPIPTTMDDTWQRICAQVCKLDYTLLLMLDVKALMA